MVVNTRKLYYGVLLFMVFLVTGSAYLSSEELQLPLNIVVLAVSLGILAINRIPKVPVYRAVQFILITAAVLVLQYLILYPSQSVSQAVYVLAKVVIALSLVIFTTKLTREETTDGLITVVTVLAWHGMIGWILYPVTVNFVQEYSNKLDTFYHVFFYLRRASSTLGTFNVFGVEVLRNQGLMWEPGVFQYFMNLGLFLCLRNLRMIRRAPLFTVAIVSTWSTLGFMLMLFNYAIFAIKRSKNMRTVVVTIFLVPVIGFLGVLAKTNIENKIYGTNVTSTQLRILDLKTNYSVIKQSPIWGNGYDFEEYCEKLKDQHVSSPVSEMITERRRGVTNSLFVLTGQFGIFILAFYLYGLYSQRLVVEEEGDRLSRISFFAMNVATLLSLPLYMAPFLLSLITSRWIRA